MQLGDPAGAARSMRRFLALALPGWTGAPNPTELDAIDWFMGCFPIRSEETRAELRHKLTAALEAKRRLD